MKKKDFKNGVWYTSLGNPKTIYLYEGHRSTNFSTTGYYHGEFKLKDWCAFGTKDYREATLEELNALGDEHLPYSRYLQDTVIKDTVYTIKDLAEPKLFIFDGKEVNTHLIDEAGQYQEPNIVSAWLKANGNPAIHKQVEREAEQLMREFSTGATRNLDEDKLDFDGFLSPLALEEFAKYMHTHRLQADGKLRDSDNWQKGIDLDSYMKSMYRHFFDTWKNHRGLETPEDQITNLCAMMFNVQGMLHELLKDK